MVSGESSQNVFTVTPGRGHRSPILVSSPHSGVAFPQEVRGSFCPEVLEHPEDTDWFVHRLYDFAPEMGMTLIHANYSRYVIDLNRDPESRSLYGDGRRETSLVPFQSFAGQSLYTREPSSDEIQRRHRCYYQPYHQKVGQLLEELKNEFGWALLFEAHSIKDFVPSLSDKPFPSLILGNNEGKSGEASFLQKAREVLQEQSYEVSVNSPFKGGYLTRFFGKPQEDIHSLQLEMCQSLYMDEGQKAYDEKRALKMRQDLQKMIDSLKKIKL